MRLSTKMASMRSVFSEIATFALSSYPLACGVFTLLFVKERTKPGSDQSVEYTLLLLHTAIVALCGICMKLRFKIGVMRALCAIESALLAANFLYFSDKLGFTWWGKVRIAIRCSGVIIGYLLTSSNIRRSSLITKLLLVLLSFYGVAMAVQVAFDPAYKFGYDRFRRWLGYDLTPTFSTGIAGITAGMLASTSLCIPFAGFRRMGLMGFLVTLLISVVSLDCNMNVWTRKHRVDYYLAARLALDDAPLVSAVVSLLV